MQNLADVTVCRSPLLYDGHISFCQGGLWLHQKCCEGVAVLSENGCFWCAHRCINLVPERRHHTLDMVTCCCLLRLRSECTTARGSI